MCVGVEHQVLASLYPTDEGGHEGFAAYAWSSRLTGAGPAVELTLGGQTGFDMTPAEARLVAAALLAAVDEIEAGS